jgi:hypothetical protein
MSLYMSFFIYHIRYMRESNHVYYSDYTLRDKAFSSSDSLPDRSLINTVTSFIHTTSTAFLKVGQDVVKGHVRTSVPG